MDSKKLAQLIKLVVEQEIKKQLPQMIKEEVSKLLNETTKPTPKKKDILEDVDPFELANQLLDKERVQPKIQKESVQPTQSIRQFSKNPTINDILNQTKPFSSAQRAEGGVGGGSSILDNFQMEEPINEGYVNSHIPNYMDAEPDIDETISYGVRGAQGGIESMRAQMAAKMGYGDMNVGATKGGLGVSTGLAGLDRILNRDNSELVKRFKK
jgi:hypothetical protein